MKLSLLKNLQAKSKEKMLKFKIFRSDFQKPLSAANTITTLSNAQAHL